MNLDFAKLPAIGSSGIAQRTIEHADSSLYHGHGKLKDLLASPVYIDLIIRAAVSAVDPHLPEEFATIGTSFEFRHEKPTVVGMSVTIKATLTAIEGSNLTFSVTAADELGEIGRGTHTRSIIQTDRFLAKVNERVKLIKPIPFK
ncbi:thioesterase family protein [Azotosporobacter soli]|uniref:thioesterase family protein n=1 Tax=Azotosporobacter soli TaxID=3055040 RepID=UPI0031FE8844